MKVEDLKVGMVVEIEHNGGKSLAMVCDSDIGLCLSGPKVWCPMTSISDDLSYQHEKVTKIYSICKYTMDAYKLSTEGRNLLWERQEKTQDDSKEKAVTITEDELTDIGAKACVDMLKDNAARILIKDDLSKLVALICAKLFDDDEEEEK